MRTITTTTPPLVVVVFVAAATPTARQWLIRLRARTRCPGELCVAEFKALWTAVQSRRMAEHDDRSRFSNLAADNFADVDDASKAM